MKIIYAVVFIVFFLGSCELKKNTINGNDEVMDKIDSISSKVSCTFVIDESKVDNINNYIDNLRLVQLETTDKALIGSIEKMFVDGNNIFIKGIEENIIIYDHKGKLVNVIDDLGAGPNEYFEITDFRVNKDGIYLYDSHKGKLSLYTHLGELKNIVDINRFNSASLLGDNVYLLFNFDPQANEYLLTGVDASQNILFEKYQEHSDRKYIGLSMVNSIHEESDVIYFCKQFENQIFKIDKKGNELDLITLDFVGRNIPEYLNKINNVADFTYSRKVLQEYPHVILGLNYFYKTSSWFCICPFMGEKYVEYFYNINNGTLLVFQDLKDSALCFTDNICGTNGNEFIAQIQSSSIEELIGHTNAKSMIELNKLKLSDEDNPILCFFTLKDH